MSYRRRGLLLAVYVGGKVGLVLDLRRIGAYLGFSFGIAWATALVIYLTGGLAYSQPLVSGTPITVALVLVPTSYMFAPALAHGLTRLITREGWEQLYLRPYLGRAWRTWIVAWLGPVLLTLIGIVVFFAVFPRFFEPSISYLREPLEGVESQTGEPLPLGVGALLVILILTAVFLSPILNSVFAFGEEFGWRAYLQPKLLPLGERRAMVAMGIVWGVWHWPLIAMGHNYGLDYPGWPWLGMLVWVWVAFAIGTVLGWLAIRGRSVWPAVIAHAMVNGTAGLGLLISSGDPSPLLGPLPAGLVGSVGWSAAALWILWMWPKSGGRSQTKVGHT